MPRSLRIFRSPVSLFHPQQLSTVVSRFERRLSIIARNPAILMLSSRRSLSSEKKAPPTNSSSAPPSRRGVLLRGAGLPALQEVAHIVRPDLRRGFEPSRHG